MNGKYLLSLSVSAFAILTTACNIDRPTEIVAASVRAEKIQPLSIKPSEGHEGDEYL